MLNKIIKETFMEVLNDSNLKLNGELNDDTVLLESGLDSMGFAVLVTSLEEKLGYDPFLLMDEPYYPNTYSEFVGIYEKYYQE